jgi:lysyl endopeptidase
MKHALFVTFSVLVFAFWAQQGNGGRPKSFKKAPLLDISEVKFPTPDLEALRAEDEMNDHTGSGPWRFGFNNYTSLNMENSGTWSDLSDGSRLWQLALTCKEALTVNLTLENVRIPAGNELYVYDPAKKFILGSFNEHHLYEGQLGTELVPGETAIVEYYIPAVNRDKEASLTIGTVTHGYRTALEFQQKAFGSSGNCNNNVNCPEGGPWTNERNAVVMLVSGSSGFCTGALVNNVLNDGKPYVLTADHCFSNPASWVFRFNWQAPDCSNPSSSPTFQSLSGAILRARAAASDFCLVEITGGLEGNTVPASYSPYFLGWDNSGNIPQSGVGIHHPAGDIKKISFENDPLISTNFGGSPANSHWGVTNWDSGVTEGGSSGSPLMDQNHRVIGQLHGGASACGAPQLSDEYGKFSYSWEPVGSNSTNQLKYWLDPNSSGAQFIDGYDPSGATAVALDAGLSAPQGVSGTLCTGTITPQVTISNSGTQILTAATISYGFDGVQDQSYNWSGTLNQWQTAVVTLPAVTLSSGSHSFSASVSAPNAGVDENNFNNSTTSSFITVVNGETVTLNLDLDCWGSETSWVLADDVSGTTLFSGNGYSDGTPGVITQNFCLNQGCYVFTLNDSYEDGMTGCTAANGGNGSYQIVYNGNVLAELLDADANFGPQYQRVFCVSLNGLEELTEQELAVYPNPAETSVTIAIRGPFTISDVSLTDLSGKQCLVKMEAQGEKMMLNLSNIAAGYYTLRIETSRGTVFREVVVK